MMTLFEAYEAAIAKGDIEDDSSQRQILHSLQRLAEQLKQPRHRWFHWGRSVQPQGLYLYGPVGVGKTYLLDLFYQQVGERQKVRFHFHHFMQQIDAQLRRLQGQRDPLQKIAADLAKRVRLLCFDEFLVHDIAHALILAELLDAFFSHGIILVATSNTAPDDLYLNGVQRARFLPAIALIKNHCEVLNLTEKRDYRLGREPLVNTYFWPLNAETERLFSEQFNTLCPGAEEGGVLSVQQREIPFIKCAERIVWFEFQVLCNLPRSQLDYLELAERFDTIFLSNIPLMKTRDSIAALLLAHFVDVSYDRGLRLIISAAVPCEELYVQGEMSETFKRTLSRLQEMQSADYLGRHQRQVLSDLQNTTAE